MTWERHLLCFADLSQYFWSIYLLNDLTVFRSDPKNGAKPLPRLRIRVQQGEDLDSQKRLRERTHYPLVFQQACSLNRWVPTFLSPDSYYMRQTLSFKRRSASAQTSHSHWHNTSICILFTFEIYAYILRNVLLFLLLLWDMQNIYSKKLHFLFIVMMIPLKNHLRQKFGP